MSYHLRDIPRGQYGEFSKIAEEVAELEDAIEQGSRLMALNELSDLLGAVQGYLDKHHPGIEVDDLVLHGRDHRSCLQVGPEGCTVTVLDRLGAYETVYTCTLSSEGSAPLGAKQVLVNPDGPAAVELIRELASALRQIQRDIRDDDLLSFDPELVGHASSIDTLLRNTGL